MTIESFLTVSAVFLVAGVVKGVSGMGLPTISMALLGLMMAPAKAAILMVVPSLATNVMQCIGAHSRSLFRKLWAMWALLALTTIFSPLSGLDAAQGGARLALGSVLIVYGVWGMFKPSFSSGGDHVLLYGGIAGVLSGLVTAATGVFVIPAVPYLQSLRLSKDELIQALGISFTVATVALMIRLGNTASQNFDSFIPEIITATVFAFIGLWLGGRFRGKLNPLQFQRSLFIVFIVLGLIIALRAL